MEIPSKDICAQVYFPQEKYLKKRDHQGKHEVLRSGHIKTKEFRSHCCFCVRHGKRADKLSARQQSIYCIKNARTALLRKHWGSTRRKIRHTEISSSGQSIRYLKRSMRRVKYHSDMGHCFS